MAELPRQVSAISPLSDAIDGTPKPRARKPRSAPVLREVTSGIVCFCGERFGEHQALEFMLHLRAEVGADLATVHRYRERLRRSNARPEVKEAQRTYARNRYRSDPEYRARLLAYQKARRGTPEFLARRREEYARRKAETGSQSLRPRS